MHSCVAYLINVIYSSLKPVRQAVLYFHCVHCRKINGGLERVKDVTENHYKYSVDLRLEPGSDSKAAFFHLHYTIIR